MAPLASLTGGTLKWEVFFIFEYFYPQFRIVLFRQVYFQRKGRNCLKMFLKPLVKVKIVNHMNASYLSLHSDFCLPIHLSMTKQA